MRRTRFSIAGGLLPFALLLAACGGSSSSGAYGGYASPSSPASAGSSGTRAASISTTQTAGGTVLVDARGFTLYYLKTDARTKVTCTGACAQTWPPALVVGGAPDAMGVPGRLGTIDNPEAGSQLTYDGWPLYTYSGDTARGQTNGQGIGGVWFAMTPTGPKDSGSGSASSGGGRY